MLLSLSKDEFAGHRQGDALSVIDTVKQVDAFDGAVLAMVEVPGDEFVFVRIGLFLDGVVEDQDAVVVLNVAHHGLDELPEGLGVKVFLG